MSRARDFADLAGSADAGGLTGRNLIINGAMTIDQRNSGAVVSAEGYLVDRWRVWRNETYDIQQSTDVPTGFSNSLKVTKTSTTQSTYAYLVHYVEGFNFAHTLFGTANAKTITLSFWVKSSVTGTFSGGLINSAGNRTYPATYTVSVSNTWEYKTITIAGDTSGTWVGSTNGIGVSVWFNFGGNGSGTANAWNAADATGGVTGNANLGTTNGATFYITGVQLEVGDTATPFEHRSYGDELARCQRYYQQFDYTDEYGSILVPTINSSTGQVRGTFTFITEMRAAPTFTSNGAGNFRINDNSNDEVASAVGIQYATKQQTAINFDKTTSNLTIGDISYVNTQATNDASMRFDAEL